MPPWLLRGLAASIAIAAAVDPVYRASRPQPLTVDWRLPPASSPDHAWATDVRNRLARTHASGAEADAVVLIGRAQPVESIDVPVFALPAEAAHPLRIAAIDVPRETAAGTAVPVRVAVTRSSPSPAPVSVGIQVDGVTIATARLKDDVARVDVVLPTAGPHRIRAVARDGTHETAADAAVIVRDARIGTLTFEPRPGWNLAFVRRALEADPLFDVRSLSRTSRAIVSRTGAAGRTLGVGDVRSATLTLVGAPDALSPAEMRTLIDAVREDGRTVVLLPDRQMTDAVHVTFGIPATVEHLLRRPVEVRVGDRMLRASEILTFRAHPSSFTMAEAPLADTAQPVIISIPHGAGDVVVVGMLDAWRHRDAATTAIAWRSFLADLAMRVRPAVAVSIDPAVARPGDDVTVTAEVRLPGAGPAPISAAIVSGSSRSELRLWPGPDGRTFVGHTAAGRVGEHTVSIDAGGPAGQASFLVAHDVLHPWAGTTLGRQAAAALSGGAIAASESDLAARLSNLRGRTVYTPVFPLRAWWWVVAFAALLGAEWWMRRRMGEA